MSKKDLYDIQSQADLWRLAEHLRQRAGVKLDPRHTEEIFKAFRLDYGYYAHRQLWIQPKDGDICQFKFNRGQWYLYAIAEWMLHKYGKVRGIIVKGRQQGISTWTEGRGYWKASQNTGTKVIVLAHESSASNNIFQMFKTYHDGVHESLKPTVGKDNEKQFEFPRLKSSVKVFSAGKKGVGRSNTCNFFHGSETAFWPHAYEHSTGIMETISEGKGSEVYLESTAYGNVNYFASQWKCAIYPWQKEIPPNWNGYVRIFIPWFWEESYRSEVPDGFELTPDEIEYKDLHDLDNEQMQWRRLKIAKAGDDIGRFSRDYPATPEEAFNSSLDNVLIQANDVLRAKKNYKDYLHHFLSEGSTTVIGCDVAREGDDATSIVVRRGRVVLHIERHYKKKGPFVASRIIKLAQIHGVDRAFVDNTGGFGGSVLDFCEAYGYYDAVGIHFSEGAEDKDQFKNIRSEMWWKMAEWVKDGAALPDDDLLQEDLCAPTYKHQMDKLLLESKEDMKSRGIKSPDSGDALALTFAKRVTPKSAMSYYEPEYV